MFSHHFLLFEKCLGNRIHDQFSTAETSSLFELLLLSSEFRSKSEKLLQDVNLSPILIFPCVKVYLSEVSVKSQCVFSYMLVSSTFFQVAKLCHNKVKVLKIVTRIVFKTLQRSSPVDSVA